jgi:hypothetical protein
MIRIKNINNSWLGWSQFNDGLREWYENENLNVPGFDSPWRYLRGFAADFLLDDLITAIRGGISSVELSAECPKLSEENLVHLYSYVEYYKAVEIIDTMLSDSPRVDTEVIKACEEVGISLRTVERVKKELNIRSGRDDSNRRIWILE